MRPVEDYCNSCGYVEDVCSIKNRHEFSPFSNEYFDFPAICIFCNVIQFCDFIDGMACWVCGKYVIPWTLSPQEESLKDLENFHTEPSREEVNSTEVVHKAVPDTFARSVKHYENWQPHEVLPGGPREFISLVDFICSEHGVDATAKDYREALLLCDSLGVKE